MILSYNYLIILYYYYHYYHENFQWVSGVEEEEESVGGRYNLPLIVIMNLYIEAWLDSAIYSGQSS